MSCQHIIPNSQTRFLMLWVIVVSCSWRDPLVVSCSSGGRMPRVQRGAQQGEPRQNRPRRSSRRQPTSCWRLTARGGECAPCVLFLPSTRSVA